MIETWFRQCSDDDRGLYPASILEKNCLLILSGSISTALQTLSNHLTRMNLRPLALSLFTFCLSQALLADYTYVDATLNNTTLEGQALTQAPPANYATASNSTDDLWSLRTVAGFEGIGTFFESDTGNSAGDSEDTDDLITSVTFPTAGTYRIVAIFDKGNNRDIAARIGSSPTQDDIFDASNYLSVDQTSAPAIVFDASYTNGRGDNAGAADLGTVTTTTDNEVVQIHINGYASTEANDSERTRYDGIGYELVVPVFPPGSTHRDVFIIAGQSNADGRGLSSELIGSLASYASQQPGVIIHYSNPAYGDTSDPLYQNWSLVRPGFSIAPGSSGALPRGTFGVEIGAATVLSQYYPNPAFIKVSRGGTSLALSEQDWHPPFPDPSDVGPLYTELISSVQQALQEITDAGDTYTLHAMFWHQGESDGNRESKYAETLKNFISSVRKDLGYPNLRFVIGELSPTKPASFREIQWQLSRDVRNASFTPSLNYTTYDGTHFDAASMISFGQRLGALLRGQERILGFEEPAFSVGNLDRQFDFSADAGLDVVASAASGEYPGGQAVGNPTLASPLAGEVERIHPLSAARSMVAEFLPSQSDSTLLVAGWAGDTNTNETFNTSETGIGMGLNSDSSFFLRTGANLHLSTGFSYQPGHWYRLTTSWTEPDQNGLRQIELRVRDLTTGTDLNSGSPLVSINIAVSSPALWNGLGLIVDRGLLDSIGVEERGYSGWMENRFPTLEGGPGADDDGDGIANSYEYALGLDPTQMDPPTSMPSPILVNDTLTLSFPNYRRAEDVLVKVFSSTDLVTWNPIEGELLTDTIDFITPLNGEPRKFLRFSLSVDD